MHWLLSRVSYKVTLLPMHDATMPLRQFQDPSFLDLVVGHLLKKVTVIIMYSVAVGHNYVLVTYFESQCL